MNQYIYLCAWPDMLKPCHLHIREVGLAESKVSVCCVTFAGEKWTNFYPFQIGFQQESTGTALLVSCLVNQWVYWDYSASYLRSHFEMLVIEVWVSAKQLYYKSSTPVWVTAQESCLPVTHCMTYGQLDCLESFHIYNLGKRLGEPWKFQELPVKFCWLSPEAPPSRRKRLSSQGWLDSTIFKMY